VKNVICLGCGAPKCKFIFSLGEMPPVNNFINPGGIEKKYPLDLYFCLKCGLVQLGDVVDPAELFSHYHHTSSASAGNVRHLKSVANLLLEQGLVNEKKILEIGSNDGLLLELLRKSGAEVLGVDPAENLTSEVLSKNVKSLVGFFDELFAVEMLKTYPKFDTIIALNVMAHTPTFISALKGVKKLLASDGTFFMENAYVLDTILKGQFDTIYHEHVFCFSLNALMKAYKSVGLQVVDAEIIPTQGKSIRVYVKHEGSQNVLSSRAKQILEKEDDVGINAEKAYAFAAEAVSQFKSKFLNYLKNNEGRKFIGIGAPARGVVMFNYCGITDAMFDFIIDDTPQKQGKLLPGCGIPIKDWDALNPSKDNKFVILSWNYADDLINKLKAMGCRGTVLLPFPEFKEVII
jgi:2-polyprenyl-3-methyl-5-hydroxy-6-metoxy-1,4-benzoquinol methylase